MSKEFMCGWVGGRVVGRLRHMFYLLHEWVGGRVGGWTGGWADGWLVGLDICWMDG